MKIIKKILFFCITLTILICMLYLICYMIPSPKIDESNQISIYDRNNEIVMQTHYDNEGSYLKIDDINEDFIAAFICSEDENFYSHLGFSLKGTLRALINNINNNTTQGGSTISQQLSRSLFLDNEKTMLRKIKEAFLTIRIETHFSKSMIIEQYLNNIYLGHNIYGIEDASLYYFNKSNKDLKLDEIAMIAGIANAPNINAPDINYDKAIKRRNYVLQRLFKNDYITHDQYKKYLNIKTKININKLSFSNPATPFFFYIKNFLKNNNLLDKKILSRGLKIYTTMDYEIQKSLISNIEEYAPNDSSEISGVVMKAFSDEILAICGGYSLDEQYLRCIYSNRPMGSTIKPLLYYLALKCGMKPDTLLSCKEKTFFIEGFDPYSPKNASNKYANKKINMIEAIALSDNIYATKTLLLVGLKRFDKLLNEFNISSSCVPSSALGVDEASLLNIVSVYNTFASLGTYYKPKIINKITYNSGVILYQNNKTYKKDILLKPYVLVINQMLTSVFDKSLIDYTSPTLINYKPATKFAAKTGTDTYNSYTIGFNPNYTIGIWCGDDNNELLKYKNISKKVFLEVANQINKENIWYNPPSYIEERSFNNSSSYWFLK